MTTNVSEKIKGLFENAEFAAKMENMTDPEAIYALFVENGVELTAEEFEEYVMAPLGDKVDKELNAAELDDVNGGVINKLLNALGKAWSGAVKVWGSEEKAAKGIINYWKDVFSGKDPTKRM